jgi:hypothetical protein
MVSQQTLEKVRHFTSGPDGPRAITVQEQLLALQWAQLKHDELYHKEITLLPVADRMKHFALHMAKYLGYFVDAIDTDSDRFERTLVDAFIITLASANTLNFDLGKALGWQENAAPVNFKAFGIELATQCFPRSEDKIWFLKQFARHCGRLAKACESLDHIESHPFREAMLASVLDMFKLFVAEGTAHQIDLINGAKERLRSVETKNIFYSYNK